MTTTFGGATLPNASKIKETPTIAFTDTLLLAGLHKVQANAHTGFGATYQCLGTWTQYEAILAFVGTAGTLITEAEPTGYSNCYISAIKVWESDNPGYFYFEVSFVRNTST